MPGKTVNVRTIAQVVTLSSTAGGNPYQVAKVADGAVVWRSVRVVIPPGHAAMTDISFWYAGQQIAPWGDFRNPLYGIPGDYTFPVDLEIDNVIDISANNRDVYAHKFYVFFEVEDLVQNATPQTVSVVPL